MTEVENRVVEMQFDNKKFEKNIRQTLRSLDNLEDHLQMDGASRGIEEFNRATKHIDLAPLGRAVDAVKVKISKLEMITIAAIHRITNKVMALGERMAKAFTIAPFKDGFAEYELKMGSVQTILASTGESLETVNGYLEELNKYSDKTIYSFRDMTANIGKFTNAGVKLKDAVKAIQGISNEAAVSGANANEASRAMYNFAQALSAGSVKLIDWKSIENANMATVEFKEELLKTALAVGTVVKEEGMYRTVTKDANGKLSDLFTTTTMFNESLSHQWMTTDVLVQTLGRYADETTDIGKKAFAAAQDVKTFSQLMDTLKESIGSGWAAAFETMFGDLEEAKSLWTSVYKVIGGSIDRTMGKFNKFLSLNLNSPYENLLDSGFIADQAKFEEEIVKIMDQTQPGSAKAIKNAGSMQNAFRQGLVGSNEIVTALSRQASALMRMSDEELRAVGITREQVREYHTWSNQLENGTRNVELFAKSLGRLSGRELIIKGISGSFKTLTGIFKTVGEAYESVFGSNKHSKWLFHFSESLYNFSRKIALNQERIESIRNACAKFFKVIKLGTDAVKEFKNELMEMASSKIRIAIESVNQKFGGTFDKARESFESFIEKVKQKTIKIGNIVDLSGIGAGLVAGVVGLVASIGNNVKKYARSALDLFSRIFEFDKIGSLFERVGSRIRTAVSDFVASNDKIQFLITMFGNLKEKMNSFGDEVVDIVGRISKNIKEGVLSAKDIVNRALNAFGNKLPDMIKSLSDISNVARNVVSIMGVIISSKILSKMAKAMTGYVKSLNIVSGFLGAIKTQVALARKSLSRLLNARAFKEAADGILKMGIAIGILSASIWLLSKLKWSDIGKGTAVILGLAAALTLMSIAVGKFGGAGGGPMNAVGVIALITTSIVALALAAKILTTVKLDEKWKKQLAMLGAMIAAIYILGRLVLSNSKEAKHVIQAAASLAIVAMSMLVLVKVLKVLANTNFDDIYANLQKLGLVFIAALATMTLLRIAGKGAGLAGIGLLAFSVALLTLIPVVKALTLLSNSELARAGIVLGALALVITLCVKILGNVGSNIAKASITAFALAATLIPLVAMAVMLGLLPVKNVLVGVGAISVLIGALSTLIFAMSKAEGMVAKSGALIFIIVMLGLMIHSLSAIPDTKSLLPAVVGLAGILLAMTTVFGILALLNKKNLDVSWRTLGAMAVLGLIVGEVAAVLALMSMVPNVHKSIIIAIALGAILGAMTTVFARLSFLDSFDFRISFRTIGMFALLGLVVGELGLILGLLTMFPNINQSLILANSIALLLDSLTLVVYKILPLGLISGVAITSVLAFGAMILELGALLYAIGALVQYNPGLQETIETAIPLLIEVSGALGEAIGNLIGGLAVGIMDQLIIASERFDVFMQNIVAASQRSEGIPEGFGQTVKDIASAILILTAAEMLQGLESLFPLQDMLGKIKMATLIGLMSDLGTGLKDLDSSLGSNFNVKGVVAAAWALERIASAAALIPESGGLLGLIWGENDLDDFSAQFTSLGSALSVLSSTAENVKLDNIQKAADSIVLLSDAASEIPNSGGYWADWFGDNTLDEFKDQFRGLGIALRLFSQQSEGIKMSNVETATKAGTMIADMAKHIPNEGGVWAQLFGDNKLDTFDDKFTTFAQALTGFSNSMDFFDSAKFNSTYNNILSYATKLSEIGPKFTSASDNIARVDFDKINSMIDSMTRLNKYIESVDWSNKWSDVDEYMDAAYPLSNVKTQIQLLGDILEETGNQAVKLDVTKFNKVATYVSDLIELGTDMVNFDDETVSNFMYTLDKFNSWLSAFRWGDYNDSDEAVDAIETVLNDMLYKIHSMEPSFTTAGNDIRNACVDGVSANDTAISTAVSGMISNILEALNSRHTTVQYLGGTFATSFYYGFSTTMKAVSESVEKKAFDLYIAFNTAVNGPNNTYPRSYYSAKYFLEGFKRGLNDYQGVTVSAVEQTADRLESAFNHRLEIRSPSRKTERTGKYFDLGMAVGITNNTSCVISSIDQLGMASLSALSGSMDQINDVLESGIELQPTIRPLIDMSDVYSGVQSIDDMFNREKANLIVRGQTASRVNESHYGDAETATPASYQFIQNNYSPKALSSSEIYRNTKNQFAMLKRRT